jgi:hypothetical protein
MRRPLLAFLGVAALALVTGNPVFAQGPVAGYSFDEIGNGSVTTTAAALPITGAIKADPGPGGPAAALTYSLRVPVVAGDVLVLEPDGQTTGLSDIVRFNAAGTSGNPNDPAPFVFHSDEFDGLAYPVTSGLPPRLYTNVLSVQEISLGAGIEGAISTPTAGQPGFVAGLTVSYAIISNVPETSPIALGGLVSVISLALIRLCRRRFAV